MNPISASPIDPSSRQEPGFRLVKLSAQHGRDWAFSAWRDEEFQVVFDANSGDFWVVSRITRNILDLLRGDPLPRHAIIAHICNDPALEIGEQDVAAVIEGLLARGLIAVEQV